jgi:hypothetical protein
MKKLYELKAELECELKRNGKTVKVHKQDCQSFTRHFKRLVADIFTGMERKGFTSLPITFTDGTQQKPYSTANGSGHSWTWMDTVTGIAIGTSDAPFDYTQYELQRKFMDATGLTKSMDVQDYDTSVRFELTATFNINAETDVKEIGLYGSTVIDYYTTKKYLVSRDVLTTPIHVVQGDVLIVRYRITIS